MFVFASLAIANQGMQLLIDNAKVWAVWVWAGMPLCRQFLFLPAAAFVLRVGDYISSWFYHGQFDTLSAVRTVLWRFRFQLAWARAFPFLEWAFGFSLVVLPQRE